MAKEEKTLADIIGKYLHLQVWKPFFEPPTNVEHYYNRTKQRMLRKYYIDKNIKYKYPIK